MKINIVGGGLAGSEIALTLASHKVKSKLYEMRPKKMTEVHKTGNLGELVCSNSLKSELLSNASGLLKAELKLLNSLLLQIAENNKIPAGKAFAVDRNKFSSEITQKIHSSKYIDLVNEEISCIDLSDRNNIWIIATGPVTSKSLENWLSQLFGENLFFFDAVAPIVSADSINMENAFIADRYGVGTGDYINCPLEKSNYENFVKELINAEQAPIENFSDKLLFERCQPIEEIAKKGKDALRYGPLKPVGLVDPKTGREPYAVMQLRSENKANTLYNLVGCQTRLKWKEQKRVFQIIPALNKAEFVRYGVMHRNTYLNSPVILNSYLQSRTYPNLFFAGQITGMEGYVESIGSGTYVSLNVLRLFQNKRMIRLPDNTMLGSLIEHVTEKARVPLNPYYANFGLLPQVNRRMNKQKKREMQSSTALTNLKKFISEVQL
ncbi:MAG: methylenetetrahydrofolate--tRNA-(uracil(54)-C(5))-methyltransferase (FADH(2)-oxidizing) TrmFO [Kosmotoga sp.]|nr:MAG: methylenetetrahydrofolate--tRNA-(uracil(54)-C(5))-methyltransferase (FADH(2)-oxidizing) TrmFO [Kosmotoga sp.]